MFVSTLLGSLGHGTSLGLCVASVSRVSTCCEHLAASRAGAWGEPLVSVSVLRPGRLWCG